VEDLGAEQASTQVTEPLNVTCRQEAVDSRAVPLSCGECATLEEVADLEAGLVRR
jgi:hypothetical protein